MLLFVVVLILLLLALLTLLLLLLLEMFVFELSTILLRGGAGGEVSMGVWGGCAGEGGHDGRGKGGGAQQWSPPLWSLRTSSVSSAGRFLLLLLVLGCGGV